MKQVDLEIKLQIIRELGEVLNKSNFSYMVYGSIGYLLVTGDKSQPIRDIDVVVRQVDFPKLAEVLVDLDFNPIQTPYAIHANSLTYSGEDDKPFDISFDSYEHYFAQHNIDFNDYLEVNLEGLQVRVMKPEDLIKIYEVGLKGNNQNKIQEYRDKIRKLKP